MSTLKTASMVVAGLVAGFALASWLPLGKRVDAPDRAGSEPPMLRSAPAPTNAGRPSDAAELSARLVRLEDALRADLAALETRVEELAAALGGANIAEESSAAAPPRDGDAPIVGPGRRAFAARGEANDDLAERLVAGGFTTDRAQWIAERVEQLPMEALRAQYEARRNGTPASAGFDFERSLREELGDADYERYLESLGRPTAVAVNGVLSSSPAELAGLREGDQIVAYGGERVYGMRDLNRLTLEGTPGEPVLLDVVRDGQQLQVVVPRGPVGITAGRFGRRP